MNTRISIGLALIAGFGLGAFSIDALHAQGKPVYVIAEVDVSDMAGYMKQYQPKAQALVEKNGARLIAASSKVTPLEGKAPPRVAVQQWESMERVKSWWDSTEQKEARKIGEKYAKFRLYVVEGR